MQLAPPKYDPFPDVQTIVSSVLGGKLSAERVCREAFSRIAERNPRVCALRTSDEAAAMQQARAVDLLLRTGAHLPLAGVPVVVKDNIAQRSLPNFAGRAAGDLAVERYDATVVERLTAAGAVIVGRGAMDEIGYGVTGQSPHGARVINPWRDDYHPGGSSAGPACAVAAGMVPLAIGTDTAGSIRIPAALTGMVGIKPTHGLVPATGVAPLAPSLDVVGPIARNCRDAAIALEVLTGRQILPSEGQPCARAKSAVVWEGPFGFRVSPAVKVIFHRAIDALQRLGISVDRQPLAALADAPRILGPILGAEASKSWMQELLDRPDIFSIEITGLLNKGACVSNERLEEASQARAGLTERMIDSMGDADIAVLPTTATPATPIADPGPQKQFLALTCPISLAGLPACTIPMGKVDGLPVGLQIVAKREQEALMMAVAAGFELGTSS